MLASRMRVAFCLLFSSNSVANPIIILKFSPLAIRPTVMAPDSPARRCLGNVSRTCSMFNDKANYTSLWTRSMNAPVSLDALRHGNESSRFCKSLSTYISHMYISVSRAVLKWTFEMPWRIWQFTTCHFMSKLDKIGIFPTISSSFFPQTCTYSDGKKKTGNWPRTPS